MKNNIYSHALHILYSPYLVPIANHTGQCSTLPTPLITVRGLIPAVLCCPSVVKRRCARRSHYTTVNINTFVETPTNKIENLCRSAFHWVKGRRYIFIFLRRFSFRHCGVQARVIDGKWHDTVIMLCFQCHKIIQCSHFSNKFYPISVQRLKYNPTNRPLICYTSSSGIGSEDTVELTLSLVDWCRSEQRSPIN